jgi:hypothetical protein
MIKGPLVVIKRNVVHPDHIFTTTMRLMSKPIDFTTSNMIILHVHVVAYATTRRVEPNSIVNAITTYD